MPPPAKDYTFCMDGIVQSGRLYTCSVCLGRDQKPLAPMTKGHMAEHTNRLTHQRRIQDLKLQASNHSGPSLESSPPDNLVPPTSDNSNNAPSVTQCNSPLVSPNPLTLDDEATSLAPPYDFFRDSAYGDIGESFASQFRTEFPVPEQRTLLPLWSKSTSARPNPYDDQSWSPFANKALFLTFSLFNAPGIHFSEPQQSAVLDWAFEMGAANVPSMYQLDKCSKTIKGLMGDSTRMVKTRTGHVFYINQVSGFLRQDFANKSIREQMEFYPHDCDGFMSEIWHGEKMALGQNREQLTPMVSHGGQSFFVNELIQLGDGSLFLADMFLKHRGDLTARGRKLEVQQLNQDHGESYFKFHNEIIDCPISQFWRSCTELAHLYPDGILVSNGDQEWRDRFIPHPLREKADGREVFSVPFVVFLDDVSGNKLNERLNIRFMSTSQYASPIEMMEGIRTDFDEAFDNPIVVWDALSGREVLVRPYIHFISGDNPIQAEECSTLGLQSNLNCRTCGAGGSSAYKMSAIGFPLQMQPGDLRSPASTIKFIQEQYNIAFISKSAQELWDCQRNSGVKDSIAQPLLEAIVKRRQELQKTTTLSLPKISEQLRAEYLEHTGSSEPQMNPLLTLRGFNVHLDTPTETLHTILLGVVKYLWFESTNRMDKQHVFSLFSTRLRSASVSGLNDGPVSTYITTNRGSLNGKHYRTLIQLAPFCLYNLVDTELMNAWVSLGRLTVLAWYPSIDSIDEYTNELQTSIYDFLYTLAKCVPAVIVQKAKAHLLVHMPMYVRRFGPLLGPNSERYESFNATFRAASVHSNRQAPSRDIANTFAVHDMVKHVLTGGHWLDNNINQHRGAGSSVIHYCASSTFIERLLGGRRPKVHDKISMSADSNYAPWESYIPPQVSCPSAILPMSLFRQVRSLCTKGGDQITPQCNVIYNSDEPSLSLGSVYDMLLPKDGGPTIVILQVYGWIELDLELQMPVVALDSGFHAVNINDIICVVNLQHRCSKAGCTDDGIEIIREERQDSSATRPAMQHRDHSHHILNTLALHNSKTIRQLSKIHFDCFAPFQSPEEYSSICKDAVASFEAINNPDTNKQDGIPASSRKGKRTRTPRTQAQSQPAYSPLAGPSTQKKHRQL